MRMQQEMKYIYTIYEEGSFSKAAEKLYLSQSALSMAVQRVEDALGDAIFDRSKRPLKLTHSGQVYIQKYYEITQLEKELEEHIIDISNLKGGSLTIGGTQYTLSYILAPVLMQYTALYPDINVRLIEYSANQLDHKLLDGSIDMCLKCDEVKSPLIKYGHAFTDNLFLAMQRSYIDKYNLPDIALSQELIMSGAFVSEQYQSLPSSYWSRLPILLLSSGNNLHTRTLELFEEHKITPNIFLELQQLVTAYHLTINGLGTTLTTEFLICKSNAPDMAYFKIDSPLMVRNFQFIMHKKGYVSKAARRFMEMTQEYYSKLLQGN